MPIGWRTHREIPIGMRSRDTPPPDSPAAANSLCASQKPLDDKRELLLYQDVLGFLKNSLWGW